MTSYKRYLYFTGPYSVRLVSLLFFIIPLLPVHAQIISTFAGTGTSGYNGDGISATTAQIFYPHNLGIDAGGNIYFPDYGNNRIRKISITTGIISTIAGTGTAGYNGDGIAATAAQLNQPTSLAFDKNGDLCFTDRANNRIRKISFPTGMISTIAGTGTGGYNGDGIVATTANISSPNDVTFDTTGNLYIADWSNQRVRKVDKASGLISTIVGTGTAGFNGDGIAANTAQINGPCGIIVENNGNIILAEYTGHRLRKVTQSTGLVSTIAGTGTAGFNGDGILATTAQLNWPAYLCRDNAGNIYIGEDASARIRMIDAATGIISTLAGTGTQGYNGDGILPTSAQLNRPYKPIFDTNNCRMYIADTYNHRVRRITGGFPFCLPAVATGNLVSCQVMPGITIDNTNNSIWVPIYDSAGRIAAEINANGNNLGNVSSSLFTKNGPCREDGSHRLYLNRNITINPQNQPASNVSVKLYIKKAELDSLRLALNSQGQPTGVASINEVDVFKNSDGCAALGTLIALPLAATNGNYKSDYYLQVSVSSFSSFYFANKLLPSILPVSIYAFSGMPQTTGNLLQWRAQCAGPVAFSIERSANGIDFTSIGNLATADCGPLFSFVDKQPDVRVNYYRIAILIGGKVAGYSPVIYLVSGQDILHLGLSSNLVAGNALTVDLSASKAQRVELIITDIAGRPIFEQSLSVTAGSQSLIVHLPAMAAGTYWLYGLGSGGRTDPLPFIKR